MKGSARIILLPRPCCLNGFLFDMRTVLLCLKTSSFKMFPLYTVYEPDTDVDLPGRPPMCLVRIPVIFFLTLRKNRARYRSNSFEGILSTFRCSPRVDFHQVRVCFHLCVLIFHALYEFVCLRIRCFSKSTFISLFYRAV